MAAYLSTSVLLADALIAQIRAGELSGANDVASSLVDMAGSVSLNPLLL